MEVISGYVEHIIYRNADNGYTVMEVVADGEEIMWIVVGRISERYKITSCTRNILEITYQGGIRK